MMRQGDGIAQTGAGADIMGGQAVFAEALPAHAADGGSRGQRFQAAALAAGAEGAVGQNSRMADLAGQVAPAPVQAAV